MVFKCRASGREAILTTTTRMDSLIGFKSRTRAAQTFTMIWNVDSTTMNSHYLTMSLIAVMRPYSL